MDTENLRKKYILWSNIVDLRSRGINTKFMFLKIPTNEKVDATDLFRKEDPSSAF